MLSSKLVFIVLLTVNVSVLLFTATLSNLNIRENRLLAVRVDEDEDKSPYRFEDPIIAYHLLNKVDIFSLVEDGALVGANYTSFSSGFTTNTNYCNEHRAYFVDHPEEMFAQTKFISTHWVRHKSRFDVLNKIGEDMPP